MPREIVMRRDGKPFTVRNKAERIALINEAWDLKCQRWTPSEIACKLGIPYNTARYVLQLSEKLRKHDISKMTKDSVALAFYDDAKRILDKFWELYNHAVEGRVVYEEDGKTVDSIRSIRPNPSQARLCLEGAGQQLERLVRLAQSFGFAIKVEEPMLPSLIQPLVLIDAGYHPTINLVMPTSPPPGLTLDAFPTNGNGHSPNGSNGNGQDPDEPEQAGGS